MSSDDKRPLGKILLQRKLVSQEELEDALRTQRRSPLPAPLASQLVDDGKLDELEALRALSEQHGVPGIDLTQVAIRLDDLDAVPREIVDSGLILPVLIRGDRLFVAMADPRNKHSIDEVEFVTGKKVYPYIAVQTTLTKTIAAAYEAKSRGERHYLGPRVPTETLRQLGLAPPFAAPVDDGSAALPTLPPTPATASSSPPEPQETRLASEVEGTRFSAEEISTGEFGAVSDDVSSVTNLPEDLRVRASQAASAMTPGDGKLVLIVDDEEEIRKMLSRLLTQNGHRILQADRGLLALRLVKDHLPDLIILDAMLPELHGFDIARRIKGSAKYGHIPIIMVSAVYRGWRIAEDLRQNYGVEQYIEKPFRIGEVMAAVHRCLRPRDGTGTGEPVRDHEHLSVEAEKALADGVNAYRAGQVDAAIDHLRRGIGIDPLAYRLHFHLGLLYGKKGQVYDGIQELERAIDLNSRHFPALKNLAVLYERAGFKNKAVEMWERCAAVAPDDATRASIKELLRKLI
jgi:DNA-binding response OmpR family regulator